jgi:hypothetical protein
MVKAHTDEIVRVLSLLTEADQVVELRLLSVARGQQFPCTMSGYFDDYQRLAENAAKYSAAARGAYVTLNPINPALLARATNRLRVAGKDCPLTADADITRRRWLPIDLDPVRPSGISSTNEEHTAAIDRGIRIRKTLSEEGWPDPILADSGNGAHVLYRIELPAIDDGIVKRCLQSLALRFDDDRVKVDQSVFNPARIWKLYGTASKKGDPVPERPHRLARVLEMA